MSEFCFGMIVGVLLVAFASLAVSRLLLLSVGQEPGSTIVIDGELQDGEPEQ